MGQHCAFQAKAGQQPRQQRRKHGRRSCLHRHVLPGAGLGRELKNEQPTQELGPVAQQLRPQKRPGTQQLRRKEQRQQPVAAGKNQPQAQRQHRAQQPQHPQQVLTGRPRLPRQRRQPRVKHAAHHGSEYHGVIIRKLGHDLPQIGAGGPEGVQQVVAQHVVHGFAKE